MRKVVVNFSIQQSVSCVVASGASMYQSLCNAGRGYGFQIRPLMDKQEYVFNDPTGINYATGAAGYKFGGLGINGLPTAPGMYPVYVEIDFEGAQKMFFPVYDDRLYQFPKAWRRITFYSPIDTSQTLTSVPSFFLATILDYQGEDVRELPTTESLLTARLFNVVKSGGVTITGKFLGDAANMPGLFSGQPIVVNPVNWFGMNDEVPADGASQRVGAFYAFQQMRAWRMVVQAVNGGAAQQLNVYTCGNDGQNEGFQLNETIPAGNWQGNFYIFERNVQFDNEWIMICKTDNVANNHVQVLSAQGIYAR